MKPQEIRDGIASYPQRQKIVACISRQGGSLHQDDFDTEFKDEPFGVTPMTDETLILGGATSFEDWLSLLNYMVAAGEVCRSGTKGNIHYSLTDEVTP